jgi:hypothetical protein
VYKFQYPKLFLFLACIVAAYLLFEQEVFDWLITKLGGKSYLGAFVAGLFFSFGFTSPFAVAFFVELAPTVDPLVASALGGIGAFFADLVIFEIIRFSFFHDELRRLHESRLLQWLHNLLHHERISEQLRRYLLWSFAGIVIASPLPDEIGVALVSGITRIEIQKVGILCFSLNTLGIFLILMIARAATV